MAQLKSFPLKAMGMHIPCNWYHGCRCPKLTHGVNALVAYLQFFASDYNVFTAECYDLLWVVMDNYEPVNGSYGHKIFTDCY